MLEVFSEFDNLSSDELNAKLYEIEDLISHFDNCIKDEEMKFKRFKVENERRQHNYIPLIFELLKSMSEKNILEDIYKNAKKELEGKK
jgi:ubiquitin carboxyl-terminal hydrolase L5